MENNMKSFKYIIEAAYVGNIGFYEMMEFLKKANKKQEKEMDRAVENNDLAAFKGLIHSVLGVKLK